MKYKSAIIVFIITASVSFVRCNDNSFDKIENNYFDNKELFDSISFIRFDTLQIGCIYMNKTGVVKIVINEGDHSEISFEDNIDSKNVETFLSKYKVDKFIFNKIFDYVIKVNCSSIKIVPNKEIIDNVLSSPIELKFNQDWGMLSVYYKIYPRILYNHEKEWFKKWLINEKKGGVLDSNVIWYLR